jgi:predicted amidohydrolase YtcJ
MKRQMHIVVVLLVVLAGVSGNCSSGGPFDADRIFVNGVVVTMDAANRVGEAVAVRGEEIIGVGTNSDVRALAGPDTEVVDLGGKTLTPGFYAAHDHFPRIGDLALYQVDLNSPPIGKVETIDGLIAAMKEKAARTPKGEWVVGRGYDDTLLAEKRHPTRHDLDKISIEHPVWIVHTSGHLGVANSLALKRANITRATRAPEGGVIRKDPRTGEPTGVLEELGGLVSRLIPPLSLEQRMKAVEWAVENYLEQGVTTAVLAYGSRELNHDLQEARRRGLLKFRIITMSARRSGPSAAEAGGFVSGFGDFRLKLGAIKIWQDGSNQGYTGYFTEPYHTPFHGDASYRGYPRRSREELTKMVKELHRAGYQIAIHGNGDAAIDDILHAFEEAQKDFPREDARHRIEHCQVVREDQLDRIAELGVTPSFFVGHVYYWGDRHHDIFMGPERANRISPLASARKRGIRFTVHDDTPVTPVDPLQLVWVSVNRLTKSERVLGGDQRVTAVEALRAITADAAWQNFEEKQKGSIEVGKLADFAVLSDNPLTVEPQRIREIQVLRTIVAGEGVYQR